MILSAKTKAFLISSVLMLAYIISDCFFRSAAFQDSNEFVVRLQARLSSNFFEVFFIIFCDILYPIVAAALLILYYALTFQKVKTLAFILYFILATYTCSLLKIFYNDPRPYWADPAVQAKECYAEYGNPSGHSMMSILLFGMIWMRYVWALAKYGEVGFLNRFWEPQTTNGAKQTDENSIPLMNSQESKCFGTVEVLENGLKINEDPHKRKASQSRSLAFVSFSICLLLVEFLILFGRIYLGMHSYNEVLLGFLYGLFSLVVYYLYLERALMSLIEEIIMRNYKYKLMGDFTDWKVLGSILAAFAFFIVFPIVVFEIYRQVVTYPAEWQERIQTICPNNGPLKLFLKKCFVDCGVIGTVFGILLGVFFTKGEYYSLKMLYSIDVNPHYVFLKEISFKKHLLRVVIVVLFSGVWAACFAVIPNKDSEYLCFFVNNLFGTFLSGFFLIKLVPLVNNKLKLEYEKDFLKYNNGELIVHNNSSIPYEEIKN